MTGGDSTVAPDLDWLLYFIIWVSVIFTVAIFVGVAWLAIRFRYKPGVNEIGHGPTHSNLLEIVWSVIPLIIVVLIAIWGFQGYMNLSVLPPAGNGTIEIQVTAFKWGWQFTYPNGYTESHLHVPKDTNIRLVLTSLDVIHSLYFPQFRVKKDVVPGRFNKFWFNATDVSPMGKDLSSGKPRDECTDLSMTDPLSFDPDEKRDSPAQMAEKELNGFDIFCAEYCGNGHSRMLSKVYVHPDFASYDQWLKTASDIWRKGPDGKAPAAIDVGLKLIKNNGCFTCHSVNGTAGTGPTWKNMWGKPVSFIDGTSIPAVDENYVRDSILYPQKQIVSGFGGAMPSFMGKLSDRDIIAIMAYMKSLSDGYTGPKSELSAEIPPPTKDETFEDYVKSLKSAPTTTPSKQPDPNEYNGKEQQTNPNGAPQQQGQGKNESQTDKTPADAKQPGPNNAAGAGNDTGK